MAESPALERALDARLAEAGLQVADLVVRRGRTEVYLEHLDASAPSLAEVEAVSRAVVEVVRDVLGEAAVEVSSPGIERRLRRPAQATGAVGRDVVVRTGASTLEGVLVGVGEAGELRMRTRGGEVEIPWADVREASTRWRWPEEDRRGGEGTGEDEASGRNDGR
jgi:ribosome maturation factor RimP